MRFGVRGYGFGVKSLVFGVWGLGFRVWVLGFWGFGVWGLGFGFWGLRSWVQGEETRGLQSAVGSTTGVFTSMCRVEIVFSFLCILFFFSFFFLCFRFSVSGFVYSVWKLRIWASGFIAYLRTSDCCL